MDCPRATGTSDITGKMVVIRHVNDIDRMNILSEFVSDSAPVRDLREAEIVIALENERMIGFGALEKDASRRGCGCVKVMERENRKGIGRSILQHLLDHAREIRSVVAARAASDYLRSSGFRNKGRAGAGGGNKADMALYER